MNAFDEFSNINVFSLKKKKMKHKGIVYPNSPLKGKMKEVTHKLYQSHNFIIY